MKSIIAVALIGAAQVAMAAPRAESALECGIAADMAVVAHSLAREEVQRPKAGAIMARIYDVSQSERGQTLMQDIIEAAYSNRGQGNEDSSSGSSGGASAQKFAEELFTECMKTGGDMDPVLGRRS